MRSTSVSAARVVVITMSLAMTTAGCASMAVGALGEAVGVPVDSKAVASKLEPNVLVAIDQSTCEVSKERWEQAKVGRSFLCAWSKS